MLKQRIITAVLLLAVLIPAVWADDPLAFVLLTALMMGAAGWEWARLCAWSSGPARASGLGFALLCFIFWREGAAAQAWPWLWWAVGSAWVLLAAGLLHGGVDAWLRVPARLRWGAGMVALFAAWVALVQARAMGVNFLFSVFVLVWGADVAAYFCGRLWGGRWITRKLAVAISPGKTWEGALGGLVLVMLVAFAWRQGEAASQWGALSLYGRLSEGGPVFMVVSVAFLTTMSVAGDLLESLFKRAAGVKDSSGLLPGHGGVLDRIDALLPVLPLAMLLCVR
jgi:phosphatidate cytidylyltransferase